MPAQALPTVAQMTEITNAIYALIAAIVLGVAGVAGAYLYQWKVQMPRRFQQQTEERETRIKALQTELANKAAAEQVDIERERMFPKLIESTISMSQNFNATMLQNVQQTAAYIARLTENDQKLTTNTDRLEELAQTVDTAITNIQVLKAAVETNTDHSKAAALYGEQAAKAATDTLELVKREINKMVGAKKSDTGEVPAVPDADAKADAPEGSAAA